MTPPATAHGRLLIQLATLPAKPVTSPLQADKRAYSEAVSRVVALAVAAELRRAGLAGARPTEAGLDDRSGAERRMAGGIGAKKVDVTWSTEEAGLLLAFSVKSINFKDKATKNYQKNLTNRRGDLLFESITLHRRFPYAVLIGLFFLDEEAQRDLTETRRSTFQNAHDRLLLFTGRSDPAGRDEQFEHLYIGLLNADSRPEPFCQFYNVGSQIQALTLDNVIDDALRTVATRNADMYTYEAGKLVSTDRPRKRGKRGMQE